MTWLPKTTVLVPVDFSEESLGAVHIAAQFVEAPEGLHLVHVLNTIHPADPGMVFDELHMTERQEQVQQLMAEKLGDLIKGATIHLPMGSPGAEIIRTAEAIDAEIIVMPSHGRTGLARLALGSVAERVLRHAHCPVLVIRD